MTKHWTVHTTASLATLLALVAPTPVARADIYQWEYINPASPSQGKQPSATLAPDGAGVSAAPGANLSNRNLTKAYLIGAELSAVVVADEEGQVLSYIYVNLTGANLSQADLSNARLYGAKLTGANLTGAEVRGARFYGAAITTDQLYSTASHQAHDLTGVYFGSINLTDADFAGQNLASAGFRGATLVNANFSQANLTNADFSILTDFVFVSSDLTGANLSQANLTNADFSGLASYNSGDEPPIIFPGTNLSGANLSGADARGANFQYATLSGENTSNLIQANGHVAGLDLTAGASQIVRDYDGNPAMSPPTGPLPVVVEQQLAMDATGALWLEFDADPWDSTISFAPGIPVALGGTLELSFALGVDVAIQVGRTIDLFDWTGVTPTGAFTVESPYTWNLSKLHTTGEVTLISVAFLPGDYNGNGTVGPEDYNFWKSSFGSTTMLAADGNGNHIVDAADYSVWRNNLGSSLGSGQGISPVGATPEPATILLAAICPIVAPIFRRRSASRLFVGRS